MRSRVCLFVLLTAAAMSQAWGQECALTVEGTDQMMFNTKEMRVSSSCKEVTVTLKHTGKLAGTIMGHNWVLSKTADYEAVAGAGVSAGPANQYVPKDDPRVLAFTTVIGGGETTSVKFDLSKLTPGTAYTYFCSFPAHYILMNGKFIIE